jgi:asparagine synthase (glutamine-hydrolysing)
MCGIAGFVHRSREYPIHRETLLRMGETLRHRGPDDSGVFIGEGVGLASRRLAILDLSSCGHMPMSTSDGRYWITYNGEVYNFKELRRSLESQGHVFRSHTDTEVVLQLFSRYGPEMLSKLNGMFALGIWDTKARTLFLARDRLGVKPLYYWKDADSLMFASEEKALFVGGVAANLNPAAVNELLSFRYVAGEGTPFDGVSRLLPGHYMVWENGAISIKRWWDLSSRVQDATPPESGEPGRWFRGMFDESVGMRLISDVPLGVLLSGGLDSSAVAASLSTQAPSGLNSFTVRFSHPGYDEGTGAQSVAGHLGLTYHELEIPGDQLVQRMEEAIWFNDEPLAHASDLHLLGISRLAKSLVTVLLSGEGSDEQLGGYVRYRPLLYPAGLTAGTAAGRLLPGFTRRNPGRLGKLARMLGLGTVDRFCLYNSAGLLPEDRRTLGSFGDGFAYRESVLHEARLAFPRDPLRQTMYYDQHTFMCSLLDRNDRMTMAASVECRVPFLDYRLVEGLRNVPTRALVDRRSSKKVLRESFASRLPGDIFRSPKWGFGVPWHIYGRTEPSLRDRIEWLPTAAGVADFGLDADALRRLIPVYLAGDDLAAGVVIQVLNLLVWRESYWRRLGTETKGRPLIKQGTTAAA